MLLSNAPFSWLIGSSTCWNCLNFPKEVIIEDSLPIPLHAQYHLLWMKTSLCLVAGGSFHLTHDLFHSTLLYSIQFSLPVTICFKNRYFFHLSKESHGICGQESFYRLTHVECIHSRMHTMQSDKQNQAVQMIFNAWFGYLEYMGCIPQGMALIILN